MEDFWSLVWHQRAEVIAMVTPEMERGTVKCHHYWPDLNEIVRTGHLVISCQFEHNFGHYVHREFLLTDVQVTQNNRRNNARPTAQPFRILKSFLPLMNPMLLFLTRAENIVAFRMSSTWIGPTTVLRCRLHSSWITSGTHRVYIRVTIRW